MAGIEKICEFSGEYIGYDMYNYKRDHIQIHPRHRKDFRSKEAVLHFFTPKTYIKMKYGYCMFSHGRDPDYSPEGRIVFQHEYFLEVFDEDILGRVNGRYVNYSYNKSSVKRRMKRMLRCKNLKVVEHSQSYWDWYLQNKKG